MADEQIKQNAEEYASKIYGYPYVEDVSCKQHYINGYIAGAHSRDELVKELEQALAFTEDVVDAQKKELEQLRNPWISVHERLPEEHQDVLIENWNGLVIRNYYISIGNINYMKDNPELFLRWMLTPKPGLN